MTYKSMLLASAAVLFTSQAMAEDLTGAFSVPSEGQFVSDTAFTYDRLKFNKKAGNDADEQHILAETIEYGLTDKFSVNATLANEFDSEGDYNNSHNFVYDLGVKYNDRSGNILYQVAANYTTANPKDFEGHKTPERWEKVLSGEFKIGYDLGDGLSTYATYALGGDIDTADRDLEQSVKVGVHKYTGQYALDLGLRYNFNTDDGNEAGGNYNDLWAEAQADYYLKDNVAVGVFGGYRLDGNYDKYVRYDYTAGVHVKVAF